MSCKRKLYWFLSVYKYHSMYRAINSSTSEKIHLPKSLNLSQVVHCDATLNIGTRKNDEVSDLLVILCLSSFLTFYGPHRLWGKKKLLLKHEVLLSTKVG